DARSAVECDELFELLAHGQPAAVAIDSPPTRGREPGASSRACERELRRLGVNIFLTPSDAEKFAHSFYDWIRVGGRAFAAAADAGYPLQDDAAVVRGRALEVFPHASDVFLRGCLPPPGTTRRVRSKRAWRLATLHAAGVSTERLCVNRVGEPTLDSIDAALAAVTARHAVEGTFSVFGETGQWIVVPGTTVEPFVRGGPVEAVVGT
ncbi:MAG TPA: DUF429 domain-containing protein, partial [Acidimicrobiales bacterium]|nr:DUF429 domain-containing protein [Acidimicrobiales bacterium]